MFVPAVANAQQLLLTWQDNSINEDGFEIECSTDGETFSSIGVVSTNVTQFIDDEVQAGFTYHYRVFAFNAYGSSGCSDVVTQYIDSPPPVEVKPEILPILESALIGSVGSAGALGLDPSTGVHTVSASGCGYRYYSDDLRFDYVEASGDVRMVVRVHDFIGDGDKARFGLMLRSSLDPSSASASMTVNGAGQFEALQRESTGASLRRKPGKSYPKGAYIAIEKKGQIVTMEYSFDGTSWSLLDYTTFGGDESYLMGISTSSCYNKKESAAVFEAVEGLDFLVLETETLNPEDGGEVAEVDLDDDSDVDDDQSAETEVSPLSFESAIIGSASLEGELELDLSTGIHTVSAAGTGYRYYQDDLRFDYVETGGDVRMVVRVHDFAGDGDKARFGLMFRSSLDPSSAHASMTVNGAGQFEALYRESTGSNLVRKPGKRYPVGAYIAIEKQDRTVRMEYSFDGLSWDLLNYTTFPDDEVYLMGISTSSFTDKRVSSAVFEVIEGLDFLSLRD